MNLGRETTPVIILKRALAKYKRLAADIMRREERGRLRGFLKSLQEEDVQVLFLPTNEQDTAQVKEIAKRSPSFVHRCWLQVAVAGESTPQDFHHLNATLVVKAIKDSLRPTFHLIDRHIINGVWGGGGPRFDH